MALAECRPTNPAHAVVAVGCCYHKGAEHGGRFPMSRTIAVAGAAAVGADELDWLGAKAPREVVPSPSAATRGPAKSREIAQPTGARAQVACHAVEQYAARPWRHSALLVAGSGGDGMRTAAAPRLCELRGSCDPDGCWLANLRDRTQQPASHVFARY
jgi:hypothetical protein